MLKLIIFLDHLGRGFMIVGAGGHGRHPNGILGLLCKAHFPSFVDFAGVRQPAWTFAHYTVCADAYDRDGRIYGHKAERVITELWVSLRLTTLLNSSHSLDILQIMIGYIASTYRISSDASRDGRWQRGRRLTKLVTNSWVTCTTRRASRPS